MVKGQRRREKGKGRREKGKGRIAVMAANFT
jgi:hypothetical protein